MNDLISRQAAIDILKEPELIFKDSTDFAGKVYSLFDIGRSTQLIVDKMRIEALPAVEAERKKGVWILMEEKPGEHTTDFIVSCSLCGGKRENPKHCKFCPNCGAEMTNGIQRSDKSETD